MQIQPRTFHSLPPKEEILKSIETQEKRIADPASYLWYVLAVADRFGSKVYEVAARSLTESGVPVTAKQLEALSKEHQAQEGSK